MRRPLLTAVVILVALAVVSASLAQSGELALPWYTVDGGGTVESTAGDFTLSGSIGQTDAG